MVAPHRILPQSLLTECQNQALAENGKLSTILRTSVERSEQYQECKLRHKALADWVINDEVKHGK